MLGHILIELLLDDVLIRRNPESLLSYYHVMDNLDVEFVARSVTEMASREPIGLDRFIPLFSAERFLYDYAEDGKLLYRLNRVMQRVKLPTLPDELLTFFPLARNRVAERADELLTPN